jgi:hypothetical protein
MKKGKTVLKKGDIAYMMYSAPHTYGRYIKVVKTDRNKAWIKQITDTRKCIMSWDWDTAYIHDFYPPYIIGKTRSIKLFKLLRVNV